MRLKSESGTWACGEVTDADFVSWGSRPWRYWLKMNRCDRCGKRRIPHRLYDMWPRKGLSHFWIICADCLIEWLSYRIKKHEEVDETNFVHFMELLDLLPVALWPADLRAAYEARPS